LYGQRHRLSLGIHVRGSEPGVSCDAAGAFLCEPFHRAQPIRRCADDPLHCELKVLPGAGHACQMEQPWLFDRFMIEFLAKHGLFPAVSKPTMGGKNRSESWRFIGSGAGWRKILIPAIFSM